MNRPFSIAIIGVGGVGGFYGGKLAARYNAPDDARVSFLVRGEHGRRIREHGLRLITPEAEQVIHPHRVVSRPEELGPTDLIFCTVKSYDLESTLLTIRSSVTDDTVILPVLNGVDNVERIRALYPHTEVWEGTVYITTRLIEPGVVRVFHSSCLLHFGAEQGTPEKLEYVRQLFLDAGITANLSGNIKQRIWEKFIFISPLAALTSYLDMPVGEIAKREDYRNLLLTLITEVVEVAKAKVIPLSGDIILKTFDRLIALPPETTSSMHTDFQKGKQTELKSLVEIVVKMGRQDNVETPCYKKLLPVLQQKESQRSIAASATTPTS